MSQRKRIALIFAMEREARPLIESLDLVKDQTFGDSKLPFQHFRGSYKDEFDLLLSINGKDPRYQVDAIGTEPATLNTYVTLRQFDPHLCINAGTAGGFANLDAKIGDVYLSSEAIRFHDRRIPIPGFDHYGIGHYPILELSEMAKALGLKEGVVSTGNSLDMTDKDLEMMMGNNASVKEMEAAGVAWVAHLLQVPLFALKAVTDFVDSPHPAHEQFLANFEVAVQNLNSKTLTVLEHLATHVEILSPPKNIRSV